jgi:hypothetical protein
MVNQTQSGAALPGTTCCALQCKDIPDRPILEMLAKNPTRWHNWCGTEWNVTEAMPSGIPSKLALAKMRMMIRRGVVDGCPCGCRGDFVITEKGLAEISSHNVESSYA